MKPFLHILITITLAFSITAQAQITTPVVKAAFGVDAELRNNYLYNNFQNSTDDWFWLPGSNASDNNRFIIDTTGAAALIASYGTSTSDPDRRMPFYRNMRFPQYSLLYNRLLIDAVFIRDYHGDDTTVFTQGSKNGDSPADWITPVSQGVPDKNDILDMMMHVRRAGPFRSDSLWMFGGLSLDNTTGNRFYDFEMYQTDIYYDRSTLKFYGYGPDAGHTRWQFNSTGDITVPGDISFSATYQSAGLTDLKAYIWIDRASLSMTPQDFNWTGEFNGAASGSTYGYAGISPKTAGAYYTGMQCDNKTWGGPFNIILANDNMVTEYTRNQFMEFSVNLTKLGLDPVTLLGGDICGMPFRRVLVKTRASESFTSTLKDFIGPFDLFLAPRVDVASETPTICETGNISIINITNYISTSTYQWSTPDGNIVSYFAGGIVVDEPGQYIVKQYLQSGCSEYAADTINIGAFDICGVLDRNMMNLRGTLQDRTAHLDWKMLSNEHVDYFEIERSVDGINFTPVGKINKNNSTLYDFEDDLQDYSKNYVYYRIRTYEAGKGFYLSHIVKLSLAGGNRSGVVLTPNPVKDMIQVEINSIVNEMVVLKIFDQSGKLVKSFDSYVRRGNNVLTFSDMNTLSKGIYQAVIHLNGERFSEKLLKAN